MIESNIGVSTDGTTGSDRAWRLVGTPRPERAERLSRTVGIRVLRMPFRRTLVLAGSVDRLRDLLVDPAGLTPAKSVRVLVAWWRAPRRGWNGGIGSIAHMTRHRVSLPGDGRGTAQVTVRLSRPAPLRDILAGTLKALGPAQPLPEPASPEITAHGLLPAYLPTARTTIVVADDLPESENIRAHDIVLRGIGTTSAVTEVPQYAIAGVPPFAVAVDATGQDLRAPSGPLVLVDAQRINPRNRRPSSYRPDAPQVQLVYAPVDRGRFSRLSARLRPAQQAQLRSAQRHPDGSRTADYVLPGNGLDAAALAMLRQIGVVHCPQLDDTDPPGTAFLLAQIAMTGAVVHAPTLPARVADLIAPELRTLLSTPVDAVDALALEARSVRQRRAALRGHATAFALPRLTTSTFPALSHLPQVSVVLATRRPEMMTATLEAIIAQTYPELEIILCLHGVELPAGLRIRLAESGRPFEIVSVPETVSFGEALGLATRRAQGSLVTKFDDDDTYSTEHVWDLVLARHYSGATLVGKGSEFVHLETLGVTVRRAVGVPETDCEAVAGGTMLIAKGDLEAVGGWRPVPRSVDYGLLDRLRRAGATIYRTHSLGYIYHRRATGHTWDPGQQYFLDATFERWPGIPRDVVLDPVDVVFDPVERDPAASLC
ncbi:glycosyltransferase [Micromonospora sp. NPDC003197]